MRLLCVIVFALVNRSRSEKNRGVERRKWLGKGMVEMLMHRFSSFHKCKAQAISLILVCDIGG